MTNQNGQKVTLVLKLKKENNSQKSEDNDNKRRIFEVNGQQCFQENNGENRNIIDVKIFNDKEIYNKLLSRPIFFSQETFENNFVAVHKTKNQLLLNQPAYIGVYILDLRKKE